MPGRHGRDRLLAGWVCGALALALGLTACADDGAVDPVAPAPTEGFTVAEVEYAAGLTEELYLPDPEGTTEGRRRRAPLVVLVPGGAWTTGDPSGLEPLAATLATIGVVAAPTHLRSAEDDVVYPTPVHDVLCAVAAAVTRARAEGFTADPVAVLGHSSGAHLAALAALTFDDLDPDCADPPVAPDALIGLAGPYDIARLPELAEPLLGSSPADEPDAWQAANPVEQAELRPDLPVLLLHGQDDADVPVDFTTGFAEALEDAGHDTTVELLPDVDHLGVFAPDVAAATVGRWLLDLDRTG